jgi:3-deoxy-D-manno-octulosonic-acid transferase
VLLADTLGEMALWYELAGIVFIGGTLSDRGGHTPYEPAAFGAALIHGPDVANFKKVFARLDGAGAADCVIDATSLAKAIVALRDPERQKNQGLAAQKALEQAVDFDALMRQVFDRLPKV